MWAKAINRDGDQTNETMKELWRGGEALEYEEHPRLEAWRR